MRRQKCLLVAVQVFAELFIFPSANNVLCVHSRAVPFLLIPIMELSVISHILLEKILHYEIHLILCYGMPTLIREIVHVAAYTLDCV